MSDALRDDLLAAALRRLNLAQRQIDNARAILGVVLDVDASVDDGDDEDTEHNPSDMDREPTPHEFPAFGGGGFTSDAGAMDARARHIGSRHNGLHVPDLTRAKPFTRDVMRADARPAADATGAADNHTSTE